MSLNKVSSASRLTLGCASLTVLLVLGGCSAYSRTSHEHDTTPPAPAAVDSEMSAAEPQTDTEALGDVPSDADTTTVMPDAGSSLRPNAPKNYVVRRGDTLWGIANMFLKDPWLWPEIWYVNPGIHNPHLIYPGDTVHLALSSDGRTALQLVRGTGPSSRLEPLLRTSPLDSAIATIPYSVIGAFLERPGVLSRDEVKAAPYILALRGEHDIAGSGDEVYVKKLDAQAGARYSVMHVDQPLKDPEGGRKLGYLAIYTGTAQLVRPGDIAKATLTDSARETLQGDVLVSEDISPTSDFKPHPPARPISGQIVAVVEGADMAGQYDVVAINRGSSDGIERGNVLTIEEFPAQSDDLCARIEDSSTCLRHPSTELPSEVNGTLLVFKTYELMSYALVLNDISPIRTYDRVRSP
jgi:hypothetical protein